MTAPDYHAATLPWPPSVNTYWRHVGHKTLISKKGREYRDQVCALYGNREPLTGRVRVTVWAYMPDRRRRDLDNLLKAPLDAIAKAGWYLDDEQIDDLRIVRLPKDERGGRIDVRVEPITEENQ